MGGDEADDENDHKSNNSGMANEEVDSHDNVAIAYGGGSINRWMVDANAGEWNELKEKNEEMVNKHAEDLVEQSE